jgi:hypothetical protein
MYLGSFDSLWLKSYLKNMIFQAHLRLRENSFFD